MDCFIEQEWLKAVAGKDFFYPAAFMDISPFVSLLAPSITRFVCNDPCYSTTMDRRLPVAAGWTLTSQTAPDRSIRDMGIEERTSTTGYHYRHVEPSILEQHFARNDGEITVIRRRGFGQYALLERPEKSIGAFVHRMDTPFEGGSNVWFLANRPKSHEPLADLWSKLAVRLADQALIVSDGSLTTFNFLMPDTSEGPEGDYRKRKAMGSIVHDGFAWSCAGYMPGRGHSLIWGLTRI